MNNKMMNKTAELGKKYALAVEFYMNYRLREHSVSSLRDEEEFYAEEMKHQETLNEVGEMVQKYHNSKNWDVLAKREKDLLTGVQSIRPKVTREWLIKDLRARFL